MELSDAEHSKRVRMLAFILEDLQSEDIRKRRRAISNLVNAKRYAWMPLQAAGTVIRNARTASDAEIDTLCAELLAFLRQASQ